MILDDAYGPALTYARRMEIDGMPMAAKAIADLAAYALRLEMQCGEDQAKAIIRQRMDAMNWEGKRK